MLTQAQYISIRDLAGATEVVPCSIYNQPQFDHVGQTDAATLRRNTYEVGNKLNLERLSKQMPLAGLAIHRVSRIRIVKERKCAR